ncbi:LPS export ABC transporter periplasmic protein LptC [Candidatus Albibeggiatoa sp. nov. NOAA]|uniref:LPS export ABC transporter periplasmic protein LptC n=1 Tax=Candidatus Albibeggiatoa sp. nov. NOAA TaxID=3162724 RepID=UPI0032F6CFB9|nr:LPS export ABC transporter periplasmic protein LptC [Thiotrichaceae bacterium]
MDKTEQEQPKKTLKKRWQHIRSDVLRWTGWIMLCVIAFATTWLSQSNKGIEATDEAMQAAEEVPDYTLKKFKTYSMTPEGKIDSQLQAQSMLHYPESNTKLSVPVMLFYKQEQPNWHVQAEKGEITPNNEDIWLQGDTTFWREETAEQTAMTILSKNVYFHKPSQFAESSEISIIRNNHTVTKSKGMKAYLQTEQVELFSRVRGHYEIK